ncbi:helix-turn-helix transcriptional regulator [Pollutimonas subterranea]|uniref:helix-turn-helix transcriptional regulator n=1 Tax=Pollutimonas subterranea TaxID=2045210 RepID=UPI001E49589C|nr:helix-turn-helix domain-containing protein [Pollutimonas subterranea]
MARNPLMTAAKTAVFSIPTNHNSGPAAGSTENDPSNWFPSRHLGEPITKALAAPALESILGHTIQGASQGLTEEKMQQHSQQQPSDHSVGRNEVSQPSDQALLYRIRTAEAKLGVSRSTIYRLVNEGQLVLIKIGKRSSGITAASVHALIERNKALAY